MTRARGTCVPSRSISNTADVRPPLHLSSRPDQTKQTLTMGAPQPSHPRSVPLCSYNSYSEHLRTIGRELAEIRGHPYSGLNRAIDYLDNIMPRSPMPACDAVNASGNRPKPSVLLFSLHSSHTLLASQVTSPARSHSSKTSARLWPPSAMICCDWRKRRRPSTLLVDLTESPKGCWCS